MRYLKKKIRNYIESQWGPKNIGTIELNCIGQKTVA